MPSVFSWREGTWPSPARARQPRVRKIKLAVGQRIGEWELLAYHPGVHQQGPGGERRKATWTCCCTCGVQREVCSDNLTFGLSRSCGHAQGARKNAVAGRH